MPPACGRSRSIHQSCARANRCTDHSVRNPSATPPARYDSPHSPPSAERSAPQTSQDYPPPSPAAAKFVWFSTFVNVVSNRACTFSVTRTTFATPRLTAARSRPLQNPDSRITEPPCSRRSRRKRRQVEVLRPRLPAIKVIRHHIRPQNRTAVRHIRIRLIVPPTVPLHSGHLAPADARRQPRPSLQQRHVGQIPAAQQLILPSAAFRNCRP